MTVTVTAPAAEKTFDQWMDHVDQWVWHKFGCSAYDLIGYPYHDAYASGVTPRTAAVRAIHNELYGDD